MSGLNKLIFCLLLLTLFIVIAPKEIIVESNNNINTEPSSLSVDIGLTYITLNINNNDDCSDKIKSDNQFKNVNFKQYDKLKNTSNVIMDSNGNPILKVDYKKAVYCAFHPDGRFG